MPVTDKPDDTEGSCLNRRGILLGGTAVLLPIVASVPDTAQAQVPIPQTASQVPGPAPGTAATNA